MKEKIKWGILGTGAASRLFAEGLLDAEGAEIFAVGSRDAHRGHDFAREFGMRRTHLSYEYFSRDDQIDAVYIGTPHSLHRDHAVLFLRAGRHVLCEKPFAINTAQAKDMVSAARQGERTLMEAMWMRFMPSIAKARELAAKGEIGEVQKVTADFGFRAEFDPENRLFDPALGGGALLDVGVYPLSFAHMLLGEPETVEGEARIGKTGVDEEAAVTLGYSGGKRAALTMSLRLDTACDASITGTSGFIRIPAPWWSSERIIVNRGGGKESTIYLPIRGNGYNYEAEEFMDLIRKGRSESKVMPLEDSLAVMRTMDRIRAEWGLRYPME